MTNSTNPNRGHWNPAPVIDRKTPANDSRTDQDSKSGSSRKGGR